VPEQHLDICCSRAFVGGDASCRVFETVNRERAPLHAVLGLVVLLIGRRNPRKRRYVTFCTLAVSFADDDEARKLAKSYGAVTLLDKMKLFAEMIPLISRCQSDRIDSTIRRTTVNRTRAA
jgi:hypothetical protein